MSKAKYQRKKLKPSSHAGLSFLQIINKPVNDLVPKMLPVV